MCRVNVLFRGLTTALYHKGGHDSVPCSVTLTKLHPKVIFKGNEPGETWAGSRSTPTPSVSPNSLWSLKQHSDFVMVKVSFRWMLIKKKKCFLGDRQPIEEAACGADVILIFQILNVTQQHWQLRCCSQERLSVSSLSGHICYVKAIDCFFLSRWSVVLIMLACCLK